MKLCGDDLFDGILEGIDIHLVQRRTNVLDISLQHLVQHLGMVHIRGHLKALRGGQPMANQLLKRLLKVGIVADDKALSGRECRSTI